jgi:hypothetical protein
MFSAVLNNGTIWVAGGSTLAYSTTGKTWTTVTAGPINVNSIAWTDFQWIACCDGSNNLYTSNDAILWKLNTSLSSFNLSKIAYANNTLFALSNNGTIFFSTSFNLGDWTTHAAGVGNITGFTYTGTHFLFSSGSTLISTQDLISWTTSSLPSSSTTLTINNSSHGTATVKPIIVACTDSSYNTLGYTYDGIQWYGCGNTVLQTRANHAAWNGDIWLAVGKSVATWFAVSKDGITWQQQSDSLFDEAYAVAWNGTAWIAAGEGSAFSLARSFDGVNWTGITGSKTLFQTRATDIKWNGYVWTACGSPTTVALSADSFVWTLSDTMGVVGDVSSVLMPTFGVVASSGANPNYVFDMSDSTAWTSQTSVYDAITGLYTGSDPLGGEWIEINMNANYTINQYYINSTANQWIFAGSTDGATWTTIDSRTSSIYTRFFSTTNTTPYQYYRVVFQKISGSSTSVQVNSIDFFQSNQELSKYFKMNNTKKCISSVVNTGYSSVMQYNNKYALTPSPILCPTSYSYNGQYNLITDLSNSLVYYCTDFSNNVFSSVSLPTIAKKYASCFNGTHFFVGGTSNTIMYAHPSDMTTWYSAITNAFNGSILSLISNSGLGFVSPPNSIFLTPGDKLSVVGPKFYDENMEKKGTVFNFGCKPF